MLAHYYKIELYHGKYDRIHQIELHSSYRQHFYTMDAIHSPAEGEFCMGENLLEAHSSKVY